MQCIMTAFAVIQVAIGLLLSKVGCAALGGFLKVRHTETSPLPATEPGAGRPPTAIGTETAIGITGIGTETVIGTVIEIAIGTAITTEITMIVDYIADGTNTIAITTMTGMG